MLYLVIPNISPPPKNGGMLNWGMLKTCCDIYCGIKFLKTGLIPNESNKEKVRNSKVKKKLINMVKKFFSTVLQQ